jgi:hypothetical protein
VEAAAGAERSRGSADDFESLLVRRFFWIFVSGTAHALSTEVHCRRYAVEGSSLGHVLRASSKVASIHATQGRCRCSHRRRPPLWSMRSTRNASLLHGPWWRELFGARAGTSVEPCEHFGAREVAPR